jgi:hypothetical protein
MNVWDRFKKLLPESGVMIGTVSTVHVNHTCTVTLAGGGSMRLVGDGYAQGDNVFIKAGEITGVAPALPYYELYV